MRSDLLRAEMAAKRMSQREVADKSQISRSAFCAKINEQRPFDVDEAVRICDVLSIVDGEKRALIFLS